MASENDGDVRKQIAELRRDVDAIKRSVQKIEQQLSAQAMFRSMKSSYKKP